jgi:glutathione synthase/RimK-type ligase-like ATP-grasp enzyme
MELRFAGVRRKSIFSPNHVSNDLQIITLTGAELMTRGHRVDWYMEEDPIDCSEYDLVFSMAQGPAGNTVLMKSLEHGGRVVNSPESVMNCYRRNMIRELQRGCIPFPASVVVRTDNGEAGQEFVQKEKFWVKRSDVHAVHKEDVTLVYSIAEQNNVLQEFHRRGITHAVLQEHLPGVTVKFYALRSTGFFHWYYVNGIMHTPFDTNRLMDLAQESAAILGLHIFGGDAIIGADGSITIIDINDWPSFAPVREEAGRQIAQLLIQKAEEHVIKF